GVTGATSGVLTSSEITTLIQDASAAYDAPITVLETAEQPITTEISALGNVKSSLSSLQSALSSLADVQSLSQRSVSSSSNAVQATATNQAALGTYNISNVKLATAESLVSSGYASASGALGAGSLTIQVGSGSAVTLDVASGQDNLTDIAATINQADLGISATVVFDGSTYDLNLFSNVTGAANVFTVSGGGGLAGLTYDGATKDLTLATKAQNASLSLNGISISSGSNTIQGAVNGVTFTLAASGSATVSVGQNVGPLVQSAQSVVQALNSALSTISQYSSYSQASGGGPLEGNVGLQIIRTDLLDAISSPGTITNGGYNSLSSVGFGITSGGQISLNTSTLQSAAESNYASVAGLLGAFGTANNPNVGVQAVSGAQAGTYAVDITANSGSTLTGTINGQAASGSNGVLTVTGPGAALGISVTVAPGVTGDLGTVSVTSGLFGQLSSILNGALNSTSGSLVNELSDLNASVTSMNQQLSTLAKQAKAETQALTQQFSAAQATISQLSTVSSFLSSYFNTASGGG
ncbi:MAG TPA: flagellar filament capping protein FliD, partial [Xanthobacteraceae bacterium]|nr:flagellar filament capping protein FliD [Xanthobacteraceae bacterium]